MHSTTDCCIRIDRANHCYDGHFKQSWQDTDIKNQNSAHAAIMTASGKNPAKTRILTLDEHTLLRYGLNAYLNSQPDMTVCAEADITNTNKRKQSSDVLDIERNL